MANNPFVIQTASNVPRVTGRKAATNAHHSTSESRWRLLASTRTMPQEKQIAGVNNNSSIQVSGASDAGCFSVPGSKDMQALTNHAEELTRDATEITDEDNGTPGAPNLTLIIPLDRILYKCSRNGCERPFGHSDRFTVLARTAGLIYTFSFAKTTASSFASKTDLETFVT